MVRTRGTVRRGREEGTYARSGDQQAQGPEKPQACYGHFWLECLHYGAEMNGD